MSYPADQTGYPLRVRACTRLLCATMLASLVCGGAEARMLVPDKPSVEVHLEVLKELQAAARGTSFAAPVPGRDSITATYLPPVGAKPVVPSEPLTASGRKIPSEQPDMGQYGELQRRPVNTPFGAPSPPLPVEAPKPKPVAKPKPKPAPVEAPKPKPVVKEEAPKVELPEVTPPAPAAQEEKQLMEALEQMTPPPAAEPVPAPLPEPPPIPDLKPDVALPEPLPAPVAAPADTPPLPVPDVLVVDKDKKPDLPSIPALPVPGAPEAELMPSLSKRMDTLFAKQPEKQGIIEDKTTLEGPSPESLKQAEEAKKQLEAQQEKVRQEQLKAQEELAKQAETLTSPVLPVPTEKPSLMSTEIAALPPVTLPGSEPASAVGADMDLPPPALPSLTPITGEGDEKSSLDIVQPGDGVESKNTLAAPMQPLDVPDTMPKVTKGEPEEITPEEEKPDLPPIPDFSAMKSPEPEAPAQEEAPKKVAMAPLPKPDFVKADEMKAPEPAPAPAVEGNASASFTFDKDKTDLDDATKAKLSALAGTIVKEGKQVRIVSFAAGTVEQASIARRVSLSRALQIRAFLIDKGVHQLKISVQAMGNKEQVERADIYLK